MPETLGARPSPCGGPKSDFKGHLVSCASARAPSLFSSRTTPGWKHHEETKGYNIASSNFTVTRTPMVPPMATDKAFFIGYKPSPACQGSQLGLEPSSPALAAAAQHKKKLP